MFARVGPPCFSAFGLLVLTAAETFTPFQFGGKGDGVSDDTLAVRAMMKAVADAGGGVAQFPEGFSFLTGAFNLSSHSVLDVQGTVLGIQASEGYPVIPPLPWYGGGQDYQESGSPEYQALIHSWDVDNITISGGGVIDGQGQPWWDCLSSDAPPCRGISRPNMMMLVHSRGIVITNVTLKDSASWFVHLANASNVLCSRMAIVADPASHNTDGWDPDCSTNVTIEDSSYDGGDDAVAVKAGIDWLGRTYGAPTRNVTVRRLRVGTAHGISVGSEMSAGVHDVLFEDIAMNGSTAGPRIKSMRGRGGAVTNVTFRNITLTGVKTGIQLTLNYKAADPTNASATPSMSGITLSGVRASGCKTGVSIDGLPESRLAGVTMRDCAFVSSGTFVGLCDYADGQCDGTVTPSCPPCLS